MAIGLFLLDATSDAVTAFEQCITWKTSLDSRVLEHNQTCDICRGWDGIKGRMYVCKECAVTTLCEDCFYGHSNGSKVCEACRHNGESFVRVPSEEWYAVEAESEADGAQEFRKEKGLVEWLRDLEKRFGRYVEA